MQGRAGSRAPPRHQPQGHDVHRAPRGALIVWHLLADPAARFTDLGHGYYQARTDIDRKIKNHIRQIEAGAPQHYHARAA